MTNILLKIYYSNFFQNIGGIIYFISGKKPWSLGYYVHRQNTIKKGIKLFKESGFGEINSYGYGLDERVVEYPWILNNIPNKSSDIFDAGSILNYQFILNDKKLKNKNILISNLNPENEFYNNKSISYLYKKYGDIRNIIAKDNVFDVVVCGSVLEHVGMDNSKIYRNGKIYKENNKDNYLQVVKEFKRVLKKDGVCLITVPFGKRQNHGWFQVFDWGMVEKIINIFGKNNSSIYFYIYSKSGWKKSSLAECKRSTYNDNSSIRSMNDQIAAGSVVCLKMIKDE